MQLFSKKMTGTKVVCVSHHRILEDGRTQVPCCQDMADLYAVCICDLKNSFELMENFTDFPLGKQLFPVDEALTD